MKSVIFLLALFIPLLHHPSYCQESDPDYDQEMFNKNYLQFFEKVKTVRVFEKSNVYSPNKDIVKAEKQLVEMKEIDKNGKLKYAKYYSYNPYKESSFYFKYDSTRLISCFKYNAAHQLEYQWDFINDTLISREIKYNVSENPVYTWEYNYDDSLNLLSLIKYNGREKPVRKLIHEYDKKGRFTGYSFFQPIHKIKYAGKIHYKDTTENVAMTYHFKRNVLMEKFVLTYDSCYNLLRKKKWGADSNYQGELKYEYDSLDRVIQITSYDQKNRSTFAIHYTYDETNRVLELVYKNKDAVLKKDEFEYDGFGNIKFHKIYNPLLYGPNEILYYNNYDANGLLVEERIERLSSNQKIIRTHEYDYYGEEELDL